jgi:tripartite-type tricarboxylate transporter receptor subunit TctC
VLLYQVALKRHALLPNVPTLAELALNDEGRTVLRTIAATAEIGRSIIVGPGVPPERLGALRAAFAAMVTDPAFIATCDKRHLMLDASTGADMDAIVKETFALPQPVLATIGAMLAEK